MIGFSKVVSSFPTVTSFPAVTSRGPRRLLSLIPTRSSCLLALHCPTRSSSPPRSPCLSVLPHPHSRSHSHSHSLPHPHTFPSSHASPPPRPSQLSRRGNRDVFSHQIRHAFFRHALLASTPFVTLTLTLFLTLLPAVTSREPRRLLS